MTKRLRYSLYPLLLGASIAGAQSLPADTSSSAPGVGFTLPRLGGSLSYGLSASQLISTGFYNNDTTYSTSFSGDLGYVSKSPNHPFSAVYDGGVLVGYGDQPTTVFQSLSFSQLYTTKNWNLSAADSVSYLPQSPTGGLSGIPGTGDLGVDPISIGPISGVGILTNYGPRVSNTLSATAGRQITGKVSAQATGTYAIQRFIGDNSGLALDSTTEGGSVGVSYRFTPRDTLTGNYNYSNFTYTANSFSFSAQGATLEYMRKWSPRLVTDVYAGPQIINGSSLAIAGNTVSLAAGASASYLSRSTAYSIVYSRGANNGSGVLPGSFADSVNAGAHRQFGRDWSLSGNFGFARTTTLPNFTLFNFNSKSVFFGGQGSRRFGRYFSGFLSYTVQDQTYNYSSSALAAQNAFSGVYQVVGFGVTYSPRSILFGR